jgi:DNA topoisomerase-1
VTEKLVGYCVKCQEKRELKDIKATFTESGRYATKGSCSTCGTAMFRFGKTLLHEGMTPPEPKPKENNGKKSKKKKKKKKKKKPGKRGKLVIVESPTKARTIGKYLGSGYKVIASQGHVRDLLKSRLSVDVDNNFEPTYRVPNEKREVVKEITAAASKAKEVWLATDPDREGEAIAWHLIEAAKLPAEGVKRVVFHEITPKAIQESFAHPRALDMKLVDAQQTRRILDRLVGFNLSPLLWQKVRGRLSAGRVQSVALRMLVERERLVREFIPQEYWSIGLNLKPQGTGQVIARLHKIAKKNIELPNQSATQLHLKALESASYVVTKVNHKKRRRRPSAPFTTSTLQQEASRRLSFSTQRTMVLAQQLYEGIKLGDDEDTVGLITYMRTDSVNVSKEAAEEARAFIEQQYGAEFVPAEIPTYKTRAKKAQEAHEAIRPTSVLRTPAAVKPYLSKSHRKLYNLIWQRFVSSQMERAIFDQTAVDIVADTTNLVSRGSITVEQSMIEQLSKDPLYLLRVTGSVMRFAGFLVVYEESKDEDDSTPETATLPDLSVGEVLHLQELLPKQHFTQPLARYSDATLVRALEENGIGRPSTYAPIVNTLTARGYSERDNKRLIPTELGELVIDMLVKHFPRVLNIGFTAQMEDELDEVAAGERDWISVLTQFYGPFSKRLEVAQEQMEKVEVAEELAGMSCEKCGREMVVRFGRYGKFIACPGFPDCRSTKPYHKLLHIGCPDCKDGQIAEKRTKRGRIFYGCSNYPECEFSSWKKPIATPCPNCQGLLVEANKKQYLCLRCETRFLREEVETKTEQAQTAESP